MDIRNRDIFELSMSRPLAAKFASARSRRGEQIYGFGHETSCGLRDSTTYSVSAGRPSGRRFAMKFETTQYQSEVPTFADGAISSPRDRRTDRLLRKPEVTARTGLSVSSIYRKEMEGRFPQRRQIGLRAVGWYESDINEFVADPLGYRSDSGRPSRRQEPGQD